MSKFVIECPSCGRYAEARKGFFARKKIDCSCGHVINVRTEKLTSRECPHCGNNVVFDQSKGEKAKCPVCHEPINTMAEQSQTVEFSCAQCGIRLRTSKGADTYTCPVCDCVNDVAERVATEKIKHDGLASIIKYEGDNSTFIWKRSREPGGGLLQGRSGARHLRPRPLYARDPAAPLARKALSAAHRYRGHLPQ